MIYPIISHLVRTIIVIICFFDILADIASPLSITRLPFATSHIPSSKCASLLNRKEKRERERKERKKKEGEKRRKKVERPFIPLTPKRVISSNSNFNTSLKASNFNTSLYWNYSRASRIRFSWRDTMLAHFSEIGVVPSCNLVIILWRCRKLS